MLDIKIKNRIYWFCKNKINDFSPTISPAPKKRESNEIESISQAIRYFLENDITEIVVQKKYMGSYCSIYLKKNIEETYFVSRNGFKIQHINNEEALESIKTLHQKMCNQFPDFDTIIIAAELLPWSVLGSGLIEKEYAGYYDALNSHFNYLKDNNLYEKLNKIKESEIFIEYQQDKINLKSKEFKTKYKSHIIRQYDALQDFKVMNLEKQETSLQIFKNQIEIFGKVEPIYFKAINVVKIVYQNGNEEIPNSNLSFSWVNDDDFLHLKFNKENEAENLEIAYQFFQNLTAENEEGIMIKPEKSYIKGIAPSFKVRNNNYLTMIYGVNFSNDFEHYLDKRNIKKKWEQSINGWEINQQMLRIPYKDLDEENYLMKILLLKRINDEEIEKNLDPRL